MQSSIPDTLRYGCWGCLCISPVLFLLMFVVSSIFEGPIEDATKKLTEPEERHDGGKITPAQYAALRQETRRKPGPPRPRTAEEIENGVMPLYTIEIPPDEREVQAMSYANSAKVMSAKKADTIHISQLPEGDYEGAWGGSEAAFTVDGVLYIVITDDSVKTPYTPCIVHVHDGVAIVEAI